MKLKFNVDGLVNGKVVFEAGKVYEIYDELGSASRWIKRGAEVVEEGELSEPLASKPEVKEEIKVEGEEEIANEEVKDENKKGKSKVKGL